MMRFCSVLLLTVCLSALNGTSSHAQASPNVVVIMTDNHGAWTLGCYGNPDIRTPNIDGLAKEGMLFSRAFASNPVCSPTRATFLTGLLPSQHGVHCFLRGGRLQTGPDARNTLNDFTSLPEILKSQGYRCGLVGKWHLGDNLHPQEGFDDYWITTPHGGTSTFYNAPVIEDGSLRNEPTYLTDFWTDHALRFLDQSREDDRPFFLFLTYNGPYALGRLLLREGQNRHAAFYANQELPSFPREPAHPWQYNNLDYLNKPTSIRRVATEVSGVDDGVGRVLDKLQELGLTDETLVMFTADQGWVGGHGGFFGMGDHTRPVTARDGMMQIPLIVKHPDHIPATTVSDQMIANYDLAPTIAGYLGQDLASFKKANSPGQDFSDLWKGQPAEENSDAAIFYEFETLRSIRTTQWKYVHRYPNGPHELYDLINDPEEKLNLVDSPVSQQTVASLKQRLMDFYHKYATPKYDLYQGGGAQSVLFVAGEKEDVDPQPATTERHAAQNVSSIQVPEGYTVEQVAGSPLVEHPMMAGFDDRGRLFVAESAGLNLRREELEQQLPNSIKMLTDQDGDGHFDHATTFADKLTLPMGALWYQDALYVAAPPKIWKFRDTDDDGVADERTELVDGFGYSGNAASIHGCFLGPDGRIYWCDGRHGHEVKNDQAGVTSKGSGSYIFSCNPDGSDVRPWCGGGMDNPVEVDFTNEGDVVGTVNILYRNPREDCFVDWQYGGVYPHSERVFAEFKRTGDLLGPVHSFGHVAVSGMTRYRSGIMDSSFRDDFFVSIFNTGRVQRVELERTGSTFKAVEREFLTSSSRDFHPTDVLEDADGSLLVVDTGGWFRIGCPTSQIAKPEISGGIYRIQRTGMPQFSDPRGIRIQWGKLTAQQLVTQLADNRHAVVQRALSEIAQRGSDTELINQLKLGLARADGHVRRNIVWGLGRIHSPEALTIVESALHDSTWQTRMAAAHVLAEYPHAPTLPQLQELLATETEPQVRKTIARALGRGKDPSSTPSLLDGLGQAVDRHEEHALLYALIEINSPDIIKPALEASSPLIRRGALIVLNEIAPQLIQRDQLLDFATSNHAILSETATSLLAEHPEWAEAIASFLRTGLQSSQKLGSPLLVSKLIQTDPVASLTADLISNRETSLELKGQLLEAVSASEARPTSPKLIQSVLEVLNEQNEQLLPVAVSTARFLQSADLDATLRTISAEPTLSKVLRVQALQAISSTKNQLDSTAFELLLSLLNDEAAGGQKLDASRLLSEAHLSTEQLFAILPALAKAGPIEVHDLIRPFSRNRDLKLNQQFFESIRLAPGFSSLQPLEISELIKSAPDDVRALGNPILDELNQRETNQRLRLERLRSSLPHGDAESGKQIFFGEKSKCSVCHTIEERGGKIGPNLSRIGRIRSRNDLLEAIIIPSSSLVREFQAFTLVDTRGRITTGIITSENSSSITIQPATGDPIHFSREDIEQLTPSHISLMPEGIDRILSEQNLSDLLEYLGAQQ